LNEVLEALVASNIGANPSVIEELMDQSWQSQTTRENLEKVKDNFNKFGELWSMEKYEDFNESIRRAIRQTKTRSPKPTTTKEVVTETDEDKERFRRFETYMWSELRKPGQDNIAVSRKQGQELINQYIGNVQFFVNLTFSFCTLGGASKLFIYKQSSLRSQFAKKILFL